MTIAASQKGLMTPAGVSFNFVNDKALARRKALRRRVSSYWDWVPRIEIPLGFCAQLLPLIRPFARLLLADRSALACADQRFAGTLPTGAWHPWLPGSLAPWHPGRLAL